MFLKEKPSSRPLPMQCEHFIKIAPEMRECISGMRKNGLREPGGK